MTQSRYSDIINTKIGGKKVIEGELPKNALELVMEWINIHEKELKEIWDTQDFKSIKPLE